MKAAAVDLNICDMFRSDTLSSIAHCSKDELVALSATYRRTYVQLKTCIDLRMAYTTTFVHPEAQDVGHITCMDVLIETKAVIEQMLAAVGQRLAALRNGVARKHNQALEKHRAALNMSIQRAMDTEQRTAAATAKSGQMPHRMPVEKEEQQRFRDAVPIPFSTMTEQDGVLLQEEAFFDELASLKQKEMLACHAYRGIVKMWIDYYLRSCSWFGPADPLADSLLLGNLYLNANAGFMSTRAATTNTTSTPSILPMSRSTTCTNKTESAPVISNTDGDIIRNRDDAHNSTNAPSITKKTLSRTELVHTETSAERVHLNFIMGEFRFFWKTLMQPFPLLFAGLHEVAIPFAYYRAYLLFQRQCSSGLEDMINRDVWSADALCVLVRLVVRVIPPLVSQFDSKVDGYAASMHDFVASNIRLFKLCPDACAMSKERLTLILQHKALPTGLLFFNRTYCLPDNVTSHLYPKVAGKSYDAYLELNHNLSAAILERTPERERANLMKLRQGSRSILLQEKANVQHNAKLSGVFSTPGSLTSDEEKLTTVARSPLSSSLSSRSSSGLLPPGVDLAQAVSTIHASKPANTTLLTTTA